MICLSLNLPITSKHKFAQGLENYFIESKINLCVKTEYRAKVGEEENRIDVAINPNDDSLLGRIHTYSIS